VVLRSYQHHHVEEVEVEGLVGEAAEAAAEAAAVAVVLVGAKDHRECWVKLGDIKYANF
jgi:hypothetical protein